MLLPKLLVFLCVFLMVGISNGAAELRAVGDSPQNMVAILVVDVFKYDGDGNEIPPADDLESATGQVCTLAVDAFDSHVIQGTAGGALLVAQVATVPLPHGHYVYTHFAHLLDSLYGNSTQPWDTNMPTAIDWVDQNGATIRLVPVDTRHYDPSIIPASIHEAITALMDQGFNQFVVNMSFGVVPCDQMPTVTQRDYVDALAVRGFSCGEDAPESLAAVLEIACNVDLESAESFYDALSSLNSDRAQAAAFTMLHLSIIRPRIEAALTAAANYDSLTSLPGQFVTTTGLSPTSIQSKAESEYSSEMLLALPPLRQIPLTDLGNLIAQDAADLGVDIIPVAAAGNDGYVFPYFPAQSQQVLSVSADYSNSAGACVPGNPGDIVSYLTGTLNWSNAQAIDASRELTRLAANFGEVEASGFTNMGPDLYLGVSDPAAIVLGCLAGSSFAAPQVSVHMAQFMLDVGGTSCSGWSAASSPPLDHNAWDNMSISAASAAYCDVFP